VTEHCTLAVTQRTSALNCPTPVISRPLSDGSRLTSAHVRPRLSDMAHTRTDVDKYRQRHTQPHSHTPCALVHPVCTCLGSSQTDTAYSCTSSSAHDLPPSIPHCTRPPPDPTGVGPTYSGTIHASSTSAQTSIRPLYRPLYNVCTSRIVLPRKTPKYRALAR